MRRQRELKTAQVEWEFVIDISPKIGGGVMQQTNRHSKQHSGLCIQMLTLGSFHWRIVPKNQVDTTPPNTSQEYQQN